MFIKTNNGYKKVDFSGSINDMCVELGYDPSQVHTYFGNINDPKISTVSLEVFTKNVLFVTPGSDYETLDERYVDNYLRDFDEKYEYSSYNAKDILERGIENRSFKIDFLARVLNIQEPNDNGLIYIPSLGYNLFFIDGVLTDIQASDGLTENAKHLKDLNPAMFRDYENQARKYWGNDLPKIINEVNKQMDSLFWIPHAMSNEFIPLHRDRNGFINFYMLRICHYVKTITLNEFLEINHGRYSEVKPLFSFSKAKTKKYVVGNFTYEFSEDGDLINYQSN